MRLSKSSFLYQWTYTFSCSKPDSEGVCTFFWKCLLVSIFNGLGILACGVICGILSLVAFLICGYKPDLTLKKDEDGLPFVPIERWPKFRGKHVMPITVLGIVAAVIGVGWLLYSTPSFLYAHSDDIRVVVASRIFLISVATLAGVFLALKFGLWSKTGVVLEKICPKIQFVDEEAAKT